MSGIPVRGFLLNELEHAGAANDAEACVPGAGTLVALKLSDDVVTVAVAFAGENSARKYCVSRWSSLLSIA